jgi:hypothetical protein
VALALAITVGVGAPAPAQAPTLPVITLEGPYAPHRSNWIDCDGVQHDDVLMAAYAEVVRDDAGVVDPAPVDVAVGYSGDLADDLEDPEAVHATPPADEYSGITLDLPARAFGTLTVTLEPGADYVLGDPSSGSVTLVDDIPTIADCTAPLALMWGAADQRIAVGEQPGGLGVTLYDDLDELRVEGALPPGLSLVDGLWQGTATTPGTYTSRVTHCVAALPGFGTMPPVACIGRADVRIVVEGPAGAAPASPGTAAPATPVDATARFTG